MLRPGLARLDQARGELLRTEAKQQSDRLRARIAAEGADPRLIDAIARLNELDGAIGIAALASELSVDEVSATHAYVALGEVLGLDWAKAEAGRFHSLDPWERSLVAGLAREFGQLRLDFLSRHRKVAPIDAVQRWQASNQARIAQFRQLTARARAMALPSAAMLAQIAAQARTLFVR
jgi:glutamate dehydrogenase